MAIDHIEDIAKDSFGHWITGLFSAIKGWNPNISFEEHREQFFVLLKRFLDQGRIKFEPPQELWSNFQGNVWAEDSDVIVSYLRERWPADAKSENDMVLQDYFYSIPPILWVGDDGRLYGA